MTSFRTSAKFVTGMNNGTIGSTGYMQFEQGITLFLSKLDSRVINPFNRVETFSQVREWDGITFFSAALVFWDYFLSYVLSWRSCYTGPDGSFFRGR